MADKMLKTGDELAQMEADMEKELLGNEPGDNQEAEPSEPRAADDDIEYVAPEPEAAASDVEGERDTGRPAKKAKAKGKAPKGDEVDDNKRQVNYGALHAEREEHRKTKAALDEQRAREARLEERLNLMQQAIQQQMQREQPPAEDGQVPEWDEDPRAHALALQERLDRMEAERQQWAQYQQQQRQQAAQQQQQRQQWEAVYKQVSQDWDEAVSEYPELVSARDALRESFDKEYKALGYDPATREQLLTRAENDLIARAYNNRVPIAQLVANMAAARVGWAPPADGEEQPAPPDQGESKPLGQSKGREALDRVAKNKQASSTLSGAGGSAPGSNRMSLDSLDRMSPAEIQEWVKRANSRDPEGADKALAKMMGI